MDTMPYSAGSAKGAVLIVVENQSVRCCALDVRPEWTFGRATPISSPDIAVKSEIVGRKHGRFTSLDGQWYYGDGGSINGTLYNGTKISSGINGRVRPIPLQNGDVLRVDTTDLMHPDPRGVMMVFLTAQAEGTWNLYALNKKKTVIGRNAACNIVQDRAYISEKHAEITYVNGSYYVTDLKSKDGTWLNGEKITGTVRLKEKDSIALCDCHFILVGDSLIYNQLEKREAYKKAPGNRGRVILKADIKTRKVPNRNGRGSKELIRDVHLEIREGTLVALLGGSGAGKSTVMKLS